MLTQQTVHSHPEQKAKQSSLLRFFHFLSGIVPQRHTKKPAVRRADSFRV